MGLAKFIPADLHEHLASRAVQEFDRMFSHSGVVKLRRNTLTCMRAVPREDLAELPLASHQIIVGPIDGSRRERPNTVMAAVDPNAPRSMQTTESSPLLIAGTIAVRHCTSSNEVRSHRKTEYWSLSPNDSMILMTLRSRLSSQMS